MDGGALSPRWSLLVIWVAAAVKGNPPHDNSATESVTAGTSSPLETAASPHQTVSSTPAYCDGGDGRPSATDHVMSQRARPGLVPEPRKGRARPGLRALGGGNETHPHIPSWSAFNQAENRQA